MNHQQHIHHAAAEDREAVLSLINSIWTQSDIKKRSPWLFTDERISDHLVYEIDGKIRGVIGAYPFDVRIDGKVFKMLGIGQVITHPEYRGKGVMGALLSQVIQNMEETGIEGSWLWGDIIRYGRYGWGAVGRSINLKINTNLLPDTDSVPEIRELTIEKDFALIRNHVSELPYSVIMPDDMLKQRLLIEGTGGWLLDDTFILMNRERDEIIFADGNPDKIRLLMGKQSSINRKKGEIPETISAKLLPAATPLMSACRALSSSFLIKHACCFRIGKLLSFLRKLFQNYHNDLFPGSGKLEIKNMDTNEEVTLIMEHGSITVVKGVGADMVLLNSAQISELLFGLLPPEVYIPGLEASNPFRILLPLNLNIPAILQNVV